MGLIDGLIGYAIKSGFDALSNSDSSVGRSFNRQQKEYHSKSVSSLNEIERKYGDKLTAEQRQNLNEKREMHKQRT